MLSTKRSFGPAYLISLSSVRGISASYIYKDNEVPGYPTGFVTLLAFAAAGIIAVVGLNDAYGRVNHKRDTLMVEDLKARYSDRDLAYMGDRSPLFRYTLQRRPSDRRVVRERGLKRCLEYF